MSCLETGGRLGARFKRKHDHGFILIALSLALFSSTHPAPSHSPTTCFHQQALDILLASPVTLSIERSLLFFFFFFLIETTKSRARDDGVGI